METNSKPIDVESISAVAEGIEKARTLPDLTGGEERAIVARGIEMLEQVWPPLMQAIRAQIRADALRELAGMVPQSLAEAKTTAHGMLVLFMTANDAKRAAYAEWAEVDRLGGSVRVQCAQELMQDQYAEGDTEPFKGPPVRKALTQSAADKAASDHPVYMAHKARLSDLTLAKAEAEDRAREAFEALQNAREYLRSFLAQSVGDVADTLAGITGQRPTDWTGPRESSR